jgi:tetratricopeptide (TPR) repeat protein
MRWLISAYRRVRGLVRAEQIHREIDEEVRFHIDMRTAENISRGMSPEEARLDAERRFGNLTRVKERGYDVRGGRRPETLWLDLRYGARMLLKKPAYDDTLALRNPAIELHPKEARFHTGLCDVYSRKGMKEKATEACKRALEIDPNFASAQELLKKLFP